MTNTRKSRIIRKHLKEILAAMPEEYIAISAEIGWTKFSKGKWQPTERLKISETKEVKDV